MSEERQDNASKAPAAGSRKQRLTPEQQRKIYCVKHGHSRLRDYCFGYHHCARCDDMLGDSLGGAYSDSSAVYVTHMQRFAHEGERARGCHCPENAKKLTKRDFALVPQWSSWGDELRPPWRKKASKASARKRPQTQPSDSKG